MDIKTLVKLAASGNIKDVEEAWLAKLEEESSHEQWMERSRVLKALADHEKLNEAETLATTTLETLDGAFDDSENLAVGCAFLQALKKSNNLRKTVGGLYRKIYSDTPGLDELMSEAGIEGGRPPRRAIRTMDVCLQLKEGMFLTHRHEDIAARVESIDFDDWQIDVNTGNSSETYGPVELADNFEPAADDDFSVMARFDPERMKAALESEPDSVITNLVRNNGGQMDSDELRNHLCPRFIADKGWSKWWTKARQALRLSQYIKIEGRAPYYLTYDPSTCSLEEETEELLAKAYDSQKELVIVEEYIRTCKLRKQEQHNKLLERARDRIEERAAKQEDQMGKIDLSHWLAAHRIRELLSEDNANAHLKEALRRAANPVKAILAVDNTSYWPAACAALEESHPENLMDSLEILLPHAPIRVADHIAETLIKLEYPVERFMELGEKILREPVEFNEGLLWLWNGPSPEGARVDIPLVSILNRILYALAEVQRRDDIPKARSRVIAQNSRDVLRAKRHARFEEMLEQIEQGVAAALRTNLVRLNNLARTGEDLVTLLRRKFPQIVAAAPIVPAWLREDVLYATSEGYNKKQAALDELVNVKIRENAVAIGKAAELGDLSENSEYKFALEERDLLQARLAQIQSEMAKSKIIRKDDISTETIGIGARVVLVNEESNTTAEVTILGPWEADPENGIFNYQTPFAQAILGSKKGQTFRTEFLEPAGEYTVSEIKNALAT